MIGSTPMRRVGSV